MNPTHDISRHIELAKFVRTSKEALESLKRVQKNHQGRVHYYQMQLEAATTPAEAARIRLLMQGAMVDEARVCCAYERHLLAVQNAVGHDSVDHYGLRR